MQKQQEFLTKTKWSAQRALPTEQRAMASQKKK